MEAPPPPTDEHKMRWYNFNEGHEILDVVECTHGDNGFLKVLLTDDVPGVGARGEIKNVRKRLARWRLIPDGKACYLTEENLKLHSNLENQAAEGKQKSSSQYSQSTARYIRNAICIVNMNFQNPWKIEPYHVSSALRKRGIICPEEALKIPEKEITGPSADIHGKGFTVSVIINKHEIAPLLCRIELVSNKVSDTINLPKWDRRKGKPQDIEPVFDGSIYDLPEGSTVSG